MARTSTYLIFLGNTEEAFLFYQKVFGTDFEGPISRMGEAPIAEGQPPLSEADKKLVMHIVLPILGGHRLMGTDVPESMGFSVTVGNNVIINLEPDTLHEAQRLFDALSAGGQVETPLQKMFWEAHYANFADKFGIHWMVNVVA